MRSRHTQRPLAIAPPRARDAQALVAGGAARERYRREHQALVTPCDDRPRIARHQLPWRLIGQARRETDDLDFVPLRVEHHCAGERPRAPLLLREA